MNAHIIFPRVLDTWANVKLRKLPSSYNLFKQLPNKFAVKREDNKHQLLKSLYNQKQNTMCNFLSSQTERKPQKEKRKRINQWENRITWG